VEKREEGEGGVGEEGGGVDAVRLLEETVETVRKIETASRAMQSAMGMGRDGERVREAVASCEEVRLAAVGCAIVAAEPVDPRDGQEAFERATSTLSETVWAARAARRRAMSRRVERPWLDELIVLLEAAKARQAAVAAVPVLQALQQVERAGNTSWQPRARSMADQHAASLAFLRRHVSDDQASTGLVYRSIVRAYVGTTAPRLVRDLNTYAALIAPLAMPTDVFGERDVLATPMRRTSSGASSAGKRAIGEADSGLRFSLDAPLVHATPTRAAAPYLDVYLATTRASLLDEQLTSSLPPLAPALLAGCSFRARPELLHWTVSRVATTALGAEWRNQDRLFREWDEDGVSQVCASLASLVCGWTRSCWDPVSLLLLRHTAESTAASLVGGTDGPTSFRRHILRSVDIIEHRFDTVFEANMASLVSLSPSSLGYLTASSTHYLTRRLADFAWSLHACVSASPTLRTSERAREWRRRLWRGGLAALDKIPATFRDPLEGTGWMINQLAHLQRALLSPGRRFGRALDDRAELDLTQRIDALLGLWTELALETTPFSLLTHATARTAKVTADEFATAWLSPSTSSSSPASPSSSSSPIDSLVHRALRSFPDLLTARQALTVGRRAIVVDHWPRFVALLRSLDLPTPLTVDQIDSHPGWTTL
jgi:hypothetical protein